MELAASEKIRLARVAEVLTGSGTEAKRLRAAMPDTSKKPSKSVPKEEEVVMEIAGEDMKGGRRSTSKDISISYMLWGMSQKVQLAGVVSLVVVVFQARHSV